MTPLSIVLIFINYLLLSSIKEGDARRYNLKREGFLIVGGYGEGGQISSAEIFNPRKGHSCPGGNLSQARHAHTLCNRMVCGGFYTDTSQSCEHQPTPSSTYTSLPVTLLQRRSYSLCWGLPNGDVLLLGGAYSTGSLETTERVSADGSTSSESFNLESGISFACGMEVDYAGSNSFFAIGGDNSLGQAVKTVTEYTESGFRRSIQDINTGRRNHACSTFRNTNGDAILLVTGGADADGNLLSSTEIYNLKIETAPWSYAASLPSARETIVSATIQNSILVFGGRRDEEMKSGSYLAEILRYDVAADSWFPAGNLTEARRSFAVAYDVLQQYCPEKTM